MPEQSVTEQIINSELPTAETAPVPEPVDNLKVADQILEQLYAPFKESLTKLSNKELRRLIMTLVKFPFLEKHEMKLKTQEEKFSFMFGERLIYANMVKRARAELDKSFGEVLKEEEQKQETLIKKEEATNEEVSTT